MDSSALGKNIGGYNMGIATTVSARIKGSNLDVGKLVETISGAMAAGGFDVRSYSFFKVSMLSGVRGGQRIRYLVTPYAVFGPNPESDGRTTAVKENISEDLFALYGLDYDSAVRAYV